MDRVDRDRIFDNLEKLVAATDYEILKNSCLDRDILKPVMVDKIEREKSTDKRHKMLWEKLTHRGPKAFDIVIDILKENNYMDAFSLLKPDSYSNKMHSISNARQAAKTFTPDTVDRVTVAASDGPCLSFSKKFDYFSSFNLVPYTEATQFSEVGMVVKKSTTEGKHRLLEVYPMRSKNRGVLLLVNIMNFADNKKDYRNGSEHDCADMITLFREMGFIVFFYDDITAVELRKILNDAIKSDYLKKADCFVFCLMSHGTILKDSLVTQIKFKDGSYESTENIVEKFANDKCYHLVGKPKIFIFPVCRGDIPDKEHIIRKGMGEIHHDGPADYISPTPSFSTYSDIIICYASVPGYRVHRNPESGSWYIQTLVKVFADFAAEYPIEDLLKKIDNEILRLRRNGGYLQTASYENRGFNRVLYFNPGYIDPSRM